MKNSHLKITLASLIALGLGLSSSSIYARIIQVQNYNCKDTKYAKSLLEKTQGDKEKAYQRCRSLVGPSYLTTFTDNALQGFIYALGGDSSKIYEKHHGKLPEKFKTLDDHAKKGFDKCQEVKYQLDNCGIKLN